MNILITGSEGFVGKNLVNLFLLDGSQFLLKPIGMHFSQICASDMLGRAGGHGWGPLFWSGVGIGIC